MRGYRVARQTPRGMPYASVANAYRVGRRASYADPPCAVKAPINFPGKSAKISPAPWSAGPEPSRNEWGSSLCDQKVLNIWAHYPDR